MDRRIRLLGIVILLSISVSMSGCLSQFPNKWAFEALQITDLHDLGFTGRGVKIGFIDTGVDLGSGGFYDQKFIKWKDLINGRDEFYDDNGHGTFIARILFSRIQSSFLGDSFRGICPDSQVIVVKAVSDTGWSNDKIISSAIDFCIKNGADIILLSLYKNPEDIAIGEKTLEMCRKALNKGIFIVAPAGDDGLNDDGDVFPIGNEGGVISVGSVNRALLISSFSSRGNQASVIGKHEKRVDPNKKPDFVAPGEGIVSIFKNEYIKRSSTSISAAFIAGSISLLLDAYPNLRRAGYENLIKVKGVLAETSKKLGNRDLYTGNDHLRHNDRYGYGLPQIYEVYKKLGEEV